MRSLGRSALSGLERGKEGEACGERGGNGEEGKQGRSKAGKEGWREGGRQEVSGARLRGAVSSAQALGAAGAAVRTPRNTTFSHSGKGILSHRMRQ